MDTQSGRQTVKTMTNPFHQEAHDRGVTLVICLFAGILLAAAAMAIYPPASRSSRQRKSWDPRSSHEISADLRSDFRGANSLGDILGLLGYLGSTAILWGGLAQWRNRYPKGDRSARRENFPVFSTAAIFVAVIATLMTLMSGNALVGFFG